MSAGKTALITGASSGIGKELARIHAERGGHLVVVARSEDKLNDLRNELVEKHGTQVKVISKDLTMPEAVNEIYQEIKNGKIKIDYLINNAGFGLLGEFYKQDWQRNQDMINLNITALTSMTHKFLDDFVKRGSGKILNVSSTASLMPGPLQAVYFATKAYVTSFSNAISEELRGTKITVTNLMPGATATDFGSTSGMDKTDMFKKAATARSVAMDGYNGMIKGRLDVISGLTFSQKILTTFIPFTPKKIVLSQIRQMQEVE